MTPRRTERFGGTSAAAPVAAGMVALMLSVNPKLGWRDVQGVVATTSRPITTNDASWQTNGAKLLFSHKFGFGLIDVDAAVRAARTWSMYTGVATDESGDVAVDSRLEKGAKLVGSFKAKSKARVLHVELTMDVEADHRGDLQIDIVS